MEFALVSLTFLLAVLGLVEGARLVYVNNMLGNAAREGARAGSVQGGWIGQTGNGCNGPQGPTCVDAGTFKTDIVTAVNGELVGIAARSSSDVTVTCGGAAPSASSCSRGALVTVKVTYTYVPLLPVLGTVSIPLSSTSSMLVQ